MIINCYYVKFTILRPINFAKAWNAQQLMDVNSSWVCSIFKLLFIHLEMIDCQVVGVYSTQWPCSPVQFTFYHVLPHSSYSTMFSRTVHVLPCSPVQFMNVLPCSPAQFMFYQPLRVTNWLTVLTGALIAYQFVLLVQATEWSHVLSLALLLFSNYYMLFKLMRDRFVLLRAYKEEQSHNSTWTLCQSWLLMYCYHCCYFIALSLSWSLSLMYCCHHCCRCCYFIALHHVIASLHFRILLIWPSYLYMIVNTAV